MKDLLIFINGVFLGLYLYYLYVIYSDNKYLIDNYKKPLLELEKKGLEIYTFSYRQGDFVMLNFDIDNELFIDLNKRSFSVLYNKKFCFNTHKKFQKDFDRLYMNLLEKFYKEIYEEVIKINDIIYSKNLFDVEIINEIKSDVSKQNIDKIFSIDNILDKINIGGFDSLTDEEKLFLKKESGD